MFFFHVDTYAICEQFLPLTFIKVPGPPRQPRIPRIGPCQVLVATLTLSQPGGEPTLYWCPPQVLEATGVPALCANVIKERSLS